MQLQCPAGQSCEVHCTSSETKDKTCFQMSVFARDSSSLLVNASTGQLSTTQTKMMYNGIIYCPSNGPTTPSDDPPCHIHCDGDDLMRYTKIYAVEGFKDMYFNAMHYDELWCYRAGSMYCTENYGSYCPMSNDDDEHPFDCQRRNGVDRTCSNVTLSHSPTVSPIPSLPPTNAPTISPTNHPTLSPTKSPTLFPTVDPTAPPTTTPTKQPTMAPTLDPTFSPTLMPTLSPTTAPTKSPTVPTFPTVPTEPPTAAPTISPTPEPTKEPTSPTLAPTVSPTDNPEPPATEPTPFPTSSPTISPTSSIYNVSDYPTASPSVSPTSFAEIEDPSRVSIAGIAAICLVGMACLVFLLLVVVPKFYRYEQREREKMLDTSPTSHEGIYSDKPNNH